MAEEGAFIAGEGRGEAEEPGAAGSAAARARNTE